MLRRHLRALAAVAALAVALPLTACGGSDSDDASTKKDLPKGSLTFAHVEDLVPEKVKTEKRCETGAWSDAKEDVDSELQDKVKTAKKYDCGDPAAPEFSEIGTYVEFTDEAAAKAYEKDEAMYGQVLRDGTTVFTVGALIDTVKFRAITEEAKSTCACGTLAGGTVSETT